MQQLEIKTKANVKKAHRNVPNISKTISELKNEKIKKLLSKAKKLLKKD